MRFIMAAGRGDFAEGRLMIDDLDRWLGASRGPTTGASDDARDRTEAYGVRPADHPHTSPLPSGEPTGATPGWVGPYRLIRRLGRGGMGTVYEAEQSAPIRRTVAVKVIRGDVCGPEVIARFEAERQALARMDHPNVARILDAGTDAGRPYFVMDVVPGVPITDFCDDHHLSVPDRLALFLQVCHGVAHAHTKAVLHRDVKASNVLAHVAADGTRRATVIDFGIAKAIGGDRLSDRLDATQVGRAVGTYESMSPEQAAGSPDLDTRTDVYALGALLYELLCGAKPFAGHLSPDLTDADVHRVIRTVDPPRPSDRLSPTAADPTAPDVARRRRTGTAGLYRRLRSELEWIPLKAMRKDRDRRYAGPLQLAEDVENYLADRPLLAGPESAAYRFRKVVRRNRAALVAAAGLAAAVAAGVGLYVRGIRAEQARTAAALADARDQRDVARRQEREAQRQTGIAAAVETFQVDMLAAVDPERLLGDKVTVVQVMTIAVAKLDAGQFADQPLVEAELRRVIGVTLGSLARYAEAEMNLRKSLAIRRASVRPTDPSLTSVLDDLAAVLVDQNRLAEGEPLLREALEISSRSPAAAAADLVKTRGQLAGLLQAQHKLGEAELLRRQVLGEIRAACPAGHPSVATAANNLAGVLAAEGKVTEAEPLYREALRIDRVALPAGNPRVAIDLNNLAVLVHGRGNSDEAEPLYREALAIRRKALPAGHPDIAQCESNLGLTLQDRNKLVEAEGLFRDALAIERGARPAGHPSIATVLNNLANCLRAQGKLSDAEPLLREGLAIDRAALPAGHPDLAVSACNLATVLRLEGKLAEAEPLCREAVALCRQARPAGCTYLAAALFNLANLRQSQGRPADAEVLYREGLGLDRHDLPAGHPGIATDLNNLAVLLQQLGRPGEAEPLFREALAIRRAALAADHPDVAGTLSNLANVLWSEKRSPEAEPLSREALGIYRRILPAGDPTLVGGLNNLAVILMTEKRFAEAEPLLSEALVVCRKVLPFGHPETANTLGSLALLLRVQHRWAEAEPVYRQALALHRIRLGVANQTTRGTAEGLAKVLDATGRSGEASALRAQYGTLNPPAATTLPTTRTAP